MELKLKDALNNLKVVCAGYKGTLDEHQALQRSLQVVEAECSRQKTGARTVAKQPKKGEKEGKKEKPNGK
jgi:hypothetical protein